MKELVDYILAIAFENKKSVTQLQLHKTSYFTFGYLLEIGEIERATQLYENEHFEAWSYGPVLPKTYSRFSRFKSTPILDQGRKSDCLSSIVGLDEVIIKFLNQDVFHLVRRSHSNKFWRTNSNKVHQNLRPEYTFTDVKRDFGIEQ